MIGRGRGAGGDPDTTVTPPDTVFTATVPHDRIEPERAPSAWDAPATSVSVMVIRHGAGAGQRFVLSTGAVMVIGRRPGCDILLADDTVSRHHAEIRPNRHGFVLADMGSLNGTYVNDQRIETAVLAHGDEVRIGIFRLSVII